MKVVHKKVKCALERHALRVQGYTFGNIYSQIFFTKEYIGESKS